MAHIEKRVTQKGVVRYQAQIVLKGHPRVSETFPTRTAAKRWAERTTEAMRQRVFNPESESEQRTVGDLIDRFILEKLHQLSDPTQNRRKLNWWRDQLGEGSASTVRRYLNVLGSVMGRATRDWFWLDSNPCRIASSTTMPVEMSSALDLAQATNDADPPYTHGVFVNLGWTSPAPTRRVPN